MSDALVIFKPDSAHRLATRAAVWQWLSQEHDWRINGLTWHQPSHDLIDSHYDFLQGKPFYPWLVNFMTALPVVVGRLIASPEALERMRYELGETRIHESRPGSLRERYGIGVGVNVLHLSDSPESGLNEVRLWSEHVALDRIDAGLTAATARPDHTFHLRSLTSQYAAGRHRELVASSVHQLLREEAELAPDSLDILSRVVLTAFN
jgi:nucleoside-diphosphate kinase